MSRIKRTFIDPVTGDSLTRAERVSWLLQASIRNFWFIGAITLATIVNGVLGHVWESDAIEGWNFAMSWLALWIESVVGISMFSQTRRDAQVLRRVERMETHMETLLEELVRKED